MVDFVYRKSILCQIILFFTITYRLIWSDMGQYVMINNKMWWYMMLATALHRLHCDMVNNARCKTIKRYFNPWYWVIGEHVFKSLVSICILAFSGTALVFQPFNLKSGFHRGHLQPRVHMSKPFEMVLTYYPLSVSILNLLLMHSFLTSIFLCIHFNILCFLWN